MCRKLFLLVSLIMVLGLVSNASAALIQHYEFEDGSASTTAADSTVNGFTGILHDGAQLLDSGGLYGSGVLYVGDSYVNGVADTDKSDRVTIPTPLMSVDAGTVAFFAKTRALHYWNYYFGMKDPDDPSGNRQRLQIATNTRFSPDPADDSYLALGLGNDWDREPNMAVTPEYMWRHIAVTWTNGGVDSYKVYLNGVMVADSSYASALTYMDTEADIGADGDGHQKGIKGYIDDVRIYDTVLSQADILLIVPEPATIMLLGLGGLALLRKRR